MTAGSQDIKPLIIAGLAAIALHPAIAVNAIKNSDLTMNDGMGGIVGWSVRSPAGSSADVRAAGGGVVSAEFGGERRSYFRQYPLTLQSGGRYRLRVDVRTAGLGGAKIQLILWDSGWHSDVGTEPFPDDTKGEWRTMEWTGRIMRNDQPDGYSVALAGDGGSAGKVRLEVRNMSLEPLTPEAEAATTDRKSVV